MLSSLSYLKSLTQKKSYHKGDWRFMNEAKIFKHSKKLQKQKKIRKIENLKG